MSANEPLAAAAFTPPRCAVAHAWLHTEMYAALEFAAAQRNLHVDELVALIVEGAVDLEMIALLVDPLK
jgi:hypothetical protein